MFLIVLLENERLPNIYMESKFFIYFLRVCNFESLELRRIRSDNYVFCLQIICITLLNIIYLSLFRFLQIFTTLQVIVSNFKKCAFNNKF